MKNLIYGIVGLIALGGTAIVGLFDWNGDQDMNYEIGDKIEIFSLTDVNGQNVSLSDVAGSSGTVIVFSCNTCPYAKLYEERILQIEDVYGDAGYPVVMINPSDPDLKPGDKIEELKKWVAANEYGSFYLIDNIGLHHRFGAEKTPEVFLLDKDLILRYRGAIDDSAPGAGSITNKYLENAIQALENDQDPDPAKTRPVGCVIKSE